MVSKTTNTTSNASEKYIPALKQKYKNEIVDAVAKEFGYVNKMQVPKIESITLNVGFGPNLGNEQNIDVIMKDLGLISGQKPVFCKSKKFVAGFKVKKGMDIGAMVSLRGNSMYEFLNKLINCAMPRIKDFHGLSTKSFDGNGNYSFGIKENGVFYECSDKIYGTGMNICIRMKMNCKKSERDTVALFFMKKFGFPFIGGN